MTCCCTPRSPRTIRADCRTRKTLANQSVGWACEFAGGFNIYESGSGHWGELWFVNVHNRSVSWGANQPTPIRIESSAPRAVVVIGGSGGSGNWPGPLYASPGRNCAGSGPCTCNNGLYGTGAEYYSDSPQPNTRIYCYTSIENALADTTCTDCPHTRPPFIGLSAAGWQSPPTGGSDTQPPTPPVLLE